MADNIIIPATGTGTATPSVATDDVGGVHYQEVKLDGGGNGASLPIIAGAQISANSLPVVGPSDEFITVSVDVTRPANTTAYAVNDAISDSTSAPTSGGFAILGAGKASGGSGILTDVEVASSNSTGGLQGEIFVFDSSVTNTNDNSAFSLSAADAKKRVTKIPFVLEPIGSASGFSAQGVMAGFTCVGAADLRFLLRVKNAYTPISGEVLTFRFKIQRMT